MANLIRRSSLKILSNLKTLTELPKPSPTLFNINNPILSLDPTRETPSKSTDKLQVYPSFPFGYFSYPIPSSGFDQLQTLETNEEAEIDDAKTIWADSVKKKRKKKMNKHKYKKLRKLLRRKT